MIYAVIAAGGIGSRMGNVEKPKQYLKGIFSHFLIQMLMYEFIKVLTKISEN